MSALANLPASLRGSGKGRSRGRQLVQQRDGDFGPPHLDPVDAGGDQLGVIAGRIGSNVPADALRTMASIFAAVTRVTDPAASRSSSRRSAWCWQTRTCNQVVMFREL